MKWDNGKERNQKHASWKEFDESNFKVEQQNRFAIYDGMVIDINESVKFMYIGKQVNMFAVWILKCLEHWCKLCLEND